MATFTHFDGNRGFYAQDWNDYVMSSFNTTQIVLTYDTGVGPFNANTHAFRVVLTLTGVTTHTFAEGPDAGKVVPIAGQITGISYRNQANIEILRVEGLAADLPRVFWQLDNDRGWAAWTAAIMGDHVFNGSSNSQRSDWNGDDMSTGFGNDTVNAGAGDDFIKDFGGSDVYHGGDGIDTLSYDSHWFSNPAFAVSGIRANWATGTVRGPDGRTDTFTSIEEIRGTNLGDVFTGDAEDNRISGMGGVDRIDGGAGWDEVRYNRDEQRGGFDGIVANLASGRIRDGFGTTDRVVNVEAVRGTNQRDRLFDNQFDNAFRAEGGNDLISMSGGSDRAIGGAGRDVFQFVGQNFGTDRIEDFSQSDRDRIEILEANGMADLTITQNGSNAEIRLNAFSVVVLQNFSASALTAADFIF